MWWCCVCAGRTGVRLSVFSIMACHVTALRQRSEVIHPDFPHFALEVIERETGGPGFFLQGAAGNVGTGKYADGDA